jgi:acetyl-CoA C-acetyltransferase
MEPDEILLAGAVRTPIGSFNGAFAEVPATVLGSAAIRAALERSGVPADAVDEVILGNVLSAGLGQNPARQAGIGAGLPPAVGATTVNKVCGSGLKAVMLAAQAIRCGDASVVVAGGMENMTRAPHLLEQARQGYRFGSAQVVDSLVRDGLSDAYDHLPMGGYGDRCGERYGFTRAQQDDFAVASYQRALHAAASGNFAGEIVPVEAPSGKAREPVSEDEQPRRFNEEKLRRLPSAFSEGGAVTAGNASSINDAAAALVVASGSAARRLGMQPQGRVLGYATASREPEWFTLAPIEAVAKLLGRISLTVHDVDLFEINEAFATVALAAMQELRIPHEKLNVHGGSIALGHPIGASGARTLVTLLHALRLRGARIGIAALCIGGGEAVAMAVERLES